MAYLPKLNPTVGGGLGGLPERKAISTQTIENSNIGDVIFSEAPPSSDWLKADGSLINQEEYSNLFEAYGNTLSNFSVTGELDYGIQEHVSSTSSVGSTWLNENTYLAVGYSGILKITAIEGSELVVEEIDLGIDTTTYQIRQVGISPDKSVLLVALNVAPWVYIYSISEGDVFTYVGTLPITTTSFVYNFSWSNSGNHLAITLNGSPRVIVCKRVGTTFTELSIGNPTYIGASQNAYVQWAHDDSHFVVTSSGFRDGKAVSVKRVNDVFTANAPSSVLSGDYYMLALATDSYYAVQVDRNNRPYKIRVLRGNASGNYTVVGSQDIMFESPNLSGGLTLMGNYGLIGVDEGRATERTLMFSWTTDGVITEEVTPSAFDNVPTMLGYFDWNDEQTIVTAKNTTYNDMYVFGYDSTTNTFTYISRYKTKNYSAHAWTPNGQYLASGNRVSIDKLVNGKLEPIGRINKYEYPFDWSFEGNYLGFYEAYSSDLINIFQVANDEVINLGYIKTLDNNGLESSPAKKGRWSPKELATVIAGFNWPASSNNMNMYLIKFVDGKFVNTQVLNTSVKPTVINSVTWSPDGTMVVVTHNVTPFISRFSYIGGVLTELTKISTAGLNNPTKAYWSSDGKFFAVINTSAPYMTMYKVSGTTFTRVTNVPNFVNPLTNVVWMNGHTNLMVAHGGVPYTTDYLLDFDETSGTVTFEELPTRYPIDGGVADIKPVLDGQMLSVATGRSFRIYNNPTNPEVKFRLPDLNTTKDYMDVIYPTAIPKNTYIKVK